MHIGRKQLYKLYKNAIQGVVAESTRRGRATPRVLLMRSPHKLRQQCGKLADYWQFEPAVLASSIDDPASNLNLGAIEVEFKDRSCNRL